MGIPSRSTRLRLYRAAAPSVARHGVITPSRCMGAQRSKKLLVRASRYRYDPAHYLLAVMDLPRVRYGSDASAELPSLSLRLELDPALVGSAMMVAGHPISPGLRAARALVVSPLTMESLDAVVRLARVRLARLLDAPAEVRVFGPLVTRENVYRLLRREQGERLWLREACRLMLSENLNPSRAAFRVGYHDATHVNRECERLFGAASLRHARQARAAAKEQAAPGERASNARWVVWPQMRRAA